MERIIDKRIQDLTQNQIKKLQRFTKGDLLLPMGTRTEKLYAEIFKHTGTRNVIHNRSYMLQNYNRYVNTLNNKLLRIATARTNLMNELIPRLKTRRKLLRKQRRLLRKPQLDFTEELKPYINNWAKNFNTVNKAFEITLRSIRIDFQYTYEFKSIEHFNNWIDLILKNEPGFTYNGDTIDNEMKDIFRGTVIIQNIKLMSGGCSKRGDRTEKHISTFYAYNTFSPVSRDNNCLFACIKHFFPEQHIYLARDIRQHFSLESGSEIDINTAVKILKYLDLDIEILLFTEADELNKHQKYILYKNGHYTCVETFTKVDMSHTKYRRGLMTFDFETRKTSKFTMIAGKTPSYQLKDTICSVYYRDYKSKIKKEIIFTTDDESSSARKFLDFLNDQSTNGKHYNIIAHNGGKFDFYFLIAQLTTFELSTSITKLRGTTIIGLNLRGNTFRDSFCYMTNSLKVLCENFNPEHGKQSEIILYAGTPKEITISSTELCFYRPELSFDEFMKLEQTDTEYWRAYCEYCVDDSKALFEIWEKFKDNIHSCIESIDPKMMKKCSLMKSMTIGGHSKTILKATNTFGKKINSYQLEMEQFTGIVRERNNELVIDEARTDLKKYLFICKFKRGGISHCHQMGKHLAGIAGVDICSQYPASLIFGRCPAGKSFWVDNDKDVIVDGKIKKKFGFYLLDNLVFNGSSKILKPIAKLIKEESLDWASNDLGKVYVDSYILDYLKNNCGLETYDVVEGLVSYKDIPMEKMFGKYVGEFFKLKALQDTYKKSGHKDYNKSLRETIKLYLNSLTGKLVEDPSIHFQLEFSDETEKMDINGAPVFKVHSETINNWIVAGVMVYSYSKRLLFEYINCLPNKADDVIHIETDGIYFDSRKLDQFKINLANYSGDYPCCKLGGEEGNELGNLEIEHNTVDKPAWFLGKKFYCIMENVIVERPFKDDKNVYKMRGVKQRTIDENGKAMIIVDSTHYERIYQGEKIPFTFSNVVSNLWGETKVSSYMKTVNIRPMGVYKLYE